MKKVPFKQVDVFSSDSFLGNPVAVVLDGGHVDTETMQRFAKWTNLSETTFILPPTRPDADYKLRIFTPDRELPFAGHPTLGSCYAWLLNGGVPINADYITQECGIGLVKLFRNEEPGLLSFEAPEPLRMEPMDEEDVLLISRGLGIDRSEIVRHSWCDNGPKWRGIMLGSMGRVLELKPDPELLRGLDIGVIGPSGNSALGFDYEVRAFFHEGNGIIEDPVTGSLNAALAQWLIRGGFAPEEYTVRQGTAINRRGIVKLSRGDGGKIFVTGHCNSVVEGVVCI